MLEIFRNYKAGKAALTIMWSSVKLQWPTVTCSDLQWPTVTLRWSILTLHTSSIIYEWHLGDLPLPNLTSTLSLSFTTIQIASQINTLWWHQKAVFQSQSRILPRTWEHGAHAELKVYNLFKTFRNQKIKNSTKCLGKFWQYLVKD